MKDANNKIMNEVALVISEHNDAVEAGHEEPILAAMLLDKFGKGVSTALNLLGVDIDVMGRIDAAIHELDPHFARNRVLNQSGSATGNVKVSTDPNDSPGAQRIKNKILYQNRDFRDATIHFRGLMHNFLSMEADSFTISCDSGKASILYYTHSGELVSTEEVSCELGCSMVFYALNELNERGINANWGYEATRDLVAVIHEGKQVVFTVRSSPLLQNRNWKAVFELNGIFKALIGHIQK